MTTATPSLRGALLLAWGVHLFTAFGAVLATLALNAIGNGAFDAAVFYMLIALWVDSIDGTLARRFHVAEVVPAIDGRRLDDIVDYLNFAIVPSVFLVELGALPSPAWAAIPVLASAYGFSQGDAKTDDDFFLGWPSYWNILAIYLFWFEISTTASSALVVGFAIAIFVPLKYIYPSKLRVWRLPSMLGGLAWGVAMLSISLWPQQSWELQLPQITLAYPAYYLGLSAVLGGWFGRRAGEFA